MTAPGNSWREMASSTSGAIGEKPAADSVWSAAVRRFCTPACGELRAAWDPHTIVTAATTAARGRVTGFNIY
jgi:hypothetical protein